MVHSRVDKVAVLEIIGLIVTHFSLAAQAAGGMRRTREAGARGWGGGAGIASGWGVVAALFRSIGLEIEAAFTSGKSGLLSPLKIFMKQL